METALKEKLEKIVEQVNVLMIDPDIEIEYCIPEVATTAEKCDINGGPYISVKHTDNKYIEKKIVLTDTYLKESSEKIASMITFTIEQFKLQVDANLMGA
ncbi:MAG: Unknown protein [uncultured Sulfurovum sp.]|uniref:Uncharacterized protein n=1 Tax=uncultured Sulfurovum sp. TaxID=269237 RepID=A0A6S6T589_9BACT|nr:MAG: Unknown protein [uncultured Sulfurovum sp.]